MKMFNVPCWLTEDFIIKDEYIDLPVAKYWGAILIGDFKAS